MTIQEKDFIRIDYIGRLEDGTEFDSTKQGENKGPLTICMGQGQLIKGLDQALIGAQIGKHTITLSPQAAFGKKSTKLIQLISANKFKKDNVRPQVGLMVNVDGTQGIIKMVSGGRVLVDFNHPLAGQTVIYDVEIYEKVTDIQQQTQGLIQFLLGPSISCSVQDATVTIKSPVPMPDSTKALIKHQLQQLIPSITTINYKTEKLNTQPTQNTQGNHSG